MERDEPPRDESPAGSAKPRVSVVIATYNRPDVTLLAIRSVLRSSFPDFEVLVIGDGCDERTGQALATITDERVRFMNLPENSGGQSAPNSKGVELARGEYVMFLNQDDFYFADHIAHALGFMERSGADIAFSPVALLQRSGRQSGPPDPAVDVIVVDGFAGKGFDPRVFVIASSWIARRDTCLAVGPWLPAEETRLSPSQEWLFRAWRQGRRIAFDPHISVLCIHAGVRRGSYLAASAEHVRAWSWVESGPSAGTDLLQCIGLNLAGQLQSNLHKRTGMLDRLIDLARHVGIHPTDLDRRRAGVAKGGWVAAVRNFTSTAAELAPGAIVRLGETTSESYLGEGWHNGEGDARWSKGTAEILFRPTGAKALDAVMEVAPLHVPGTATLSVNRRIVLTHHFTSPGATTLRLPLGAPEGIVRLRLEVDGATSPQQLDGRPDDRILGLRVSSLKLEDAQA